ncbi:hypothetical protein E8K88_06660 [Lampropedia aestuarii]|uniref:Uncharacterized protein n=1 Tax=Lampropedia aestuarii TaxID=2562762 RepID=A0A4S5BNG8_9BURK|nr:hypothetical protein [Lampropedia aestuarii]THJ34207.1 hypothetical protein E8K88_06660 [Lampropedia aestuarii]
MKWHFVAKGILVIALASHAWAEKISYPPIFSDIPVQRFSPIEHERFDLINLELKNLISNSKASELNNSFCASGFIFSDGKPLTMVIWENKDRLYWWRGSEGELSREQSLTLFFSPASDLKNSVDEDAVMISSTALKHSQAKAAIDYCEKFGQKYLVPPFTPEPEKTDDDEFELEDIEGIEDTQKLKVAQ